MPREIREAIATHPEWVGGKALLTVVLLRLERFDEARSLVKEFLATAKDPPMTVRLLIGQELEDQSQVQDLAGKVYESAARDFAARPTNDVNNNMSPSVKLLGWYRSAGRMDECRDLMLKLARTKAENSPYDAAYTESQRINMMLNYAQQLAGMGYPADAVMLYREQIAAVEAFAADPLSSQYINKEWTIQNAGQGIRQTLIAARPEALAPTVAALFRSIPGTGKGGPGVDLFVSIPSSDFEKNVITSTLADAFDKLVGKRPALNEREIAASLATILEKNPDDLPTSIAIALYAFAEGNADEVDRTVTRLTTLVEKTPLEQIKASKATRGKVPRPNARQRAEALKQVDLWLVAKACWARDSTRSRGDFFATRAVEAARRQADSRWPSIMLREWGQSALDRGDRPTAERRWAELLELVIPPIDSPRAEISRPSQASARWLPGPETVDHPGDSQGRVRQGDDFGPDGCRPQDDLAFNSSRPRGVPWRVAGWRSARDRCLEHDRQPQQSQCFCDHQDGQRRHPERPEQCQSGSPSRPDPRLHPDQSVPARDDLEPRRCQLSGGL